MRWTAQERTPIVEQLRRLIEEHAWQHRFAAAIASVARQRIASLAAIDSVDDYLRWLDDLGAMGAA